MKSQNSNISNNNVDINIDFNLQDTLKHSLYCFFKEKKEHINKILPIINRTSPISLRLLDYFCVNYSRCFRISYLVDNQPFDVHNSYKLQLKTYSKKSFDPFKRNMRIIFPIDDNNKLDTTIAQLCFFKWCLQHKILDYIEQNLESINLDMKKNITIKDKDKTHIKPHGTETPIINKHRSSRKKSSINLTAIRVPAPPGMTSVIVSFN